MALVKVSSPIVRDKVIPRILFMGVPSLETTFIRHTFNLDGSIIVSDESKNELKINPFSFGFAGTVEVSEDAVAQVVMVSYKFKYLGKTYEVQVYFYFGVDYGQRVKIKVKGNLPIKGKINLKFVATTGVYDPSLRRFYSGVFVDEVLLGVGLDWSDVKNSWGFDPSTKTLSINVQPNFEFDPSTIVTSTNSAAIYVPFQRKSLYASSRHWVLVMNAIYSSPDGLAPWTLASDPATPDIAQARQISLFSAGGAYADQAYSREVIAGYDYVCYRRMELKSDGTITFGSTINAIPSWQDEDGNDNSPPYSRTCFYWRKVQAISPDVWILCHTIGISPDWTTEINTGRAGTGSKTMFRPYNTVTTPTDFGYSTIGGSIWTSSGDQKLGCRFQAPRTEAISKIKVRMAQAPIGNARVGIYSDSSGAPSSLLGQSNEVSIDLLPAWYEFTFATPINVTAGSYYWLAVISPYAVTLFYDAGTTSQAGYNNDTYADGFSDPFGTPTYQDRKYTMFAYSTSLPTTIQSKGWMYGDGSGNRKKLSFLDGRIIASATLNNPTTAAHAGNFYVRLWVASSSDLSDATPLTDWGYVAVSFPAGGGQQTATVNLDVVPASAGDAFAVQEKYFYVECLWDITTQADNARVQIGSDGFEGTVILPPQHELYYVNVAVDDQGYPWIGFARFNGTYTGSYKNSYPYIARGDANDGTWTFRLCSVRKLSITPSYGVSIVASCWRVIPVPLTSGKMRAVFLGPASSTIESQLWDGSSWTTQNLPTINWAGRNYFSAINDGDDTIVGVLEATTFHIKVIKHTYATGWDASYTIVQSSTKSTSTPVLSWQQSGVFKVFWAGSPTADHIYYKTVTNMIPDTDPTDWIDESVDHLTVNDRLTCFYKIYGYNIGLAYMRKQASPYDVRYDFLSFAPPAVVLQMIGDGLTWVVS